MDVAKQFADNKAVLALIEAGEKAGKIAREMYNESQQNGGTTLGVQVKNNDFEHIGFEDVVTAVDMACDAAIQPILKGCKNIPVLSEETAEMYKDNAEIGDERWLVDPIDGTFCLKNGKEDFSITLALQEKTAKGWRTMFGGVSVPMSGEIIVSDESKSYVVKEGEAQSVKLQCEEVPAFTGGLEDAFKDKKVEVVVYKRAGEEFANDEDPIANRWMQTRAGICSALGESATTTFSTAKVLTDMLHGKCNGVMLAANALDYAWDTDAALDIVQKGGAKIKRYEFMGEPVVLVAESQALFTAMEHTLVREMASVMGQEAQSNRPMASAPYGAAQAR